MFHFIDLSYGTCLRKPNRTLLVFCSLVIMYFPHTIKCYKTPEPVTESAKLFNKETPPYVQKTPKLG